MTQRIGRRSFLKKSSGAALGATAVTLFGSSRAVAAGENVFRSAWPQQAERPWAGPEYWTNPLEDWRIREGRLECICPGGDRNVFLLTREVSGREGVLAMSVRLGRLEEGSETPGHDSSSGCPFHSEPGGVKGAEKKLEGGFAGFRVGIKSFVDDYRARAIHGPGPWASWWVIDFIRRISSGAEQCASGLQNGLSAVRSSTRTMITLTGPSCLRSTR